MDRRDLILTLIAVALLSASIIVLLAKPRPTLTTITPSHPPVTAQNHTVSLPSPTKTVNKCCTTSIVHTVSASTATTGVHEKQRIKRESRSTNYTCRVSAPQPVDWRSLVAWDSGMCRGSFSLVNAESLRCALNQSIALKALAEKIVGDACTNPLDALVKAARWVAWHVRYVYEPGFDIVQMPLDTLRKGGDCEDLSYLVVSLVHAACPDVRVAIVAYESPRDGHCMPAVILANGSIYAVAVVRDPYPMSLADDLCGYISSLVGEKIEKVRIVSADGEKTVDIDCRAVYPPPMPPRNLLSAKLTRLLSTRCSAPVNSTYSLLVPVDWYSGKSVEWIAERITTRLFEVLGGCCRGVVKSVEYVERNGALYVRVILAPS